MGCGGPAGKRRLETGLDILRSRSIVSRTIVSIARIGTRSIAFPCALHGHQTGRIGSKRNDGVFADFDVRFRQWEIEYGLEFPLNVADEPGGEQVVLDVEFADVATTVDRPQTKVEESLSLLVRGKKGVPVEGRVLEAVPAVSELRENFEAAAAERDEALTTTNGGGVSHGR